MWKTGSPLLHKTQLVPIQPSLWLHHQHKIQAIFWKTKEKSVKPFNFRMTSTLQESKISLRNKHGSILPQTPPWIIRNLEVILELKTPQNKNPSLHLSGEISQYPGTPSLTPICLHGCLQGQWQSDMHSCSKLNNYQEISSNAKLHLNSRSPYNKSSTRHHLKEQTKNVYFQIRSVSLSLSNKKPWESSNR